MPYARFPLGRSGSLAIVRATIGGLGALAALSACSGFATAPPDGDELTPADIVLSTSELNLAAGDTSRLLAVVVNSSGRPIASPSSGASAASARTTWSSSDPRIAEVSRSGLVLAKQNGSATVTAQSGNLYRRSTIKVNGPANRSVVISPVVDTLAAGQTRQFSAHVLNNGGNPTSDPIGWASRNPEIADVDTTGKVLAKAVGIAIIVATGAGSADSATVVVQTAQEQPDLPPADPTPEPDPVPGPDPAPVSECATPEPGWIWCDDFEKDRLSTYFERRNSSRLQRVDGVGMDGSWGMRARFDAGTINAGDLKLAFGKTPDPYMRPVPGTENRHYREIYWRMYVRNQPGWVGGGADKLSRATVFAGSDWSQAMIAHVWSGGSPSNNAFLVADPASGTDTAGNLQTTRYNDFANLRWLGAARGSNPIFTGFALGEWHCVEAQARLNDPGQSNGLFRIWVNGELDSERNGLNWLGSYSDYGINAVFFENYWNDGSPEPQERYFDNIVVSTERIGC